MRKKKKRNMAEGVLYPEGVDGKAAMGSTDAGRRMIAASYEGTSAKASSDALNGRYR